tara:strand:- start:233 stop:448 length:216 start_codon:yes stop_codon:yes gene_type:complete
MRPKGVPNKLTSAVKYKLDAIIDETMESINIDSLTNAEKIKLVEVCLKYVMPRNISDSYQLPDEIQIEIVR